MAAGGVVILTGAGISAESGIRTFRASDGLWEEHRVEDVATSEGFARDPALVHRFYNARRHKLQQASPNAAHTALADFEARCECDFLLVTQNIDDLHERGGSQRLVHMHGELLKMRCLHCDYHSGVCDDLSVEHICPVCRQSGGLRPDIVWFGEMPYRMDEINLALAHCALFVSIGTSGNVYPAAGFVRQARAAAARCVELNLEKTGGGDLFTDSVYGKATDIVPAFFDDLAL